MYCPECGTKTKAISTKNIPDVRAITVRYRLCPKCGCAVETAEEIIRVMQKSKTGEEG